MKIRVALLAVALAAAPSSADIQYVDNSEGQFVWTESFHILADFHPGASLDLTLDASQSGAPTARSFSAYSETYLTSNELVTVNVQADPAANVRVARGETIFLNFGPWSGNVYPAVTFTEGTPIGPDIGAGTWELEADIDYRSGQNSASLIGGRAFIGVSLELPDGVHYGWIDLQDNGYNANPSLVPLAWAWETEPGVPIPAGVIPAPASAMVLGAALIPLRRRRVS
jgi:hypothetical protein